jgi:heme/copper-type cytochrome/quinol oxidase subunit 2
MKDPSDNDNSGKIKSKENIFYIMDGIIDQLNKTKKLFIIMIITIMIIPPIVFVLTFALFGAPFHNGDRNWSDGKTFEPNFNPTIRFVPLIPIIIVIGWLAIGIRQWFVLSKWDKRYKKYKELQKKVDEKLEDADDDDDYKENG